MKTVAQYRAERTRAQTLGKFHIAHFPVGTVVEYENPAALRLSDEEKVTRPYQSYTSGVGVVSGVIQNGINSWVVEFTTLCPFGMETIARVNMSWVRKIIKRGTGKLTEEDQAVFNETLKHLADARAEHENKWGKANKYSSFMPSFSKGTYKTYDLSTLVHHYLVKQPKDDHYVNVDLLVKKLAVMTKANWHQEGYFGGYLLINKKRFARLFAKAYNHSKTNRAKAAYLDDLESQKAMEEALDREHDLLDDAGY